MSEQTDQAVPELYHIKPAPACADHQFTHQGAMEVKCATCPIGFYLSGDEAVRDGHIYRGDQLLI